MSCLLPNLSSFSFSKCLNVKMRRVVLEMYANKENRAFQSVTDLIRLASNLKVVAAFNDVIIAWIAVASETTMQVKYKCILYIWNNIFHFCTFEWHNYFTTLFEKSNRMFERHQFLIALDSFINLSQGPDCTRLRSAFFFN